MIYIWALVGLIVISSLAVYLLRFTEKSNKDTEGDDFEIIEE